MQKFNSVKMVNGKWYYNKELSNCLVDNGKEKEMKRQKKKSFFFVLFNDQIWKTLQLAMLFIFWGISLKNKHSFSP